MHQERPMSRNDFNACYTKLPTVHEYSPSTNNGNDSTCSSSRNTTSLFKRDNFTSSIIEF